MLQANTLAQTQNILCLRIKTVVPLSDGRIQSIAHVTRKSSKDAGKSTMRGMLIIATMQRPTYTLMAVRK
jgi:hypothetical protein